MIVLFPSSALAQSTQLPSQITPKTFEPPRAAIAVPPALNGVGGGAAPPGAETLLFTLGGVAVAGEHPSLVAARKDLFAGVVGTEISVKSLFEIAGRLEQVYVNAGFLLARVTVPAQQLDDNSSARLVIVNGFIERLDTIAVAPHVAHLVRDRLERLVGRAWLQREDLERALLIAGDVAGLTLTSAIGAGAQPGGVVLILQGAHKAVSLSLNVDNRLGRAFHHWQGSSLVSLNDVLGFGEQIYSSLGADRAVRTFFEDDPELRIFAVGSTVPLGVDGFTVSLEYTASATRAPVTAGVLDSPGRMRRLSGRAAYPLIRTRAEILTAQASIELLEQFSATPAFGTLKNHDAYASTRQDLTWVGALPSGAPMQVGASWSHGLGGRGAGDAAREQVPLTRQGASPSFDKLSANLHVTQPLPDNVLQVSLQLNAQTSFGVPLLASEQITLDGQTLVSGLDAGLFAVDEGMAARLELAGPLPLDVSGVSVLPYVFGAFGRGRLGQPTAVESALVKGASYGFGLRGQFVEPTRQSEHMVSVELARFDLVGHSEERGSKLTVVLGSRF
jgi:hemolysin activation/secretion protein